MVSAWKVLALAEAIGILLLLVFGGGPQSGPISPAPTEAIPAAEKTRIAPDELPAPLPAISGRAPESEKENVVASSGPQSGDLLLFGYIYGPNEQPLVNIRVYGYDRWGQYRYARTEEDGRYVLLGFAPGIVRLTVTGLGWSDAKRRVRLTAEEETRQEDFRLSARFEIPVAFETGNGQPLEELLMGSKLHQAMHQRFLSVYADSGEDPGKIPATNQSRYEPFGSHWRDRGFLGGDAPAGLLPRYAGVLSCEQHPPFTAVLAYRDSIVKTMPVTREMEELVFSLSAEDFEKLTGEVRFRFVDGDDGHPLEGRYSLLYGQGMDAPQPLNLQGNHLPGLVPGSWTIFPVVDGYERQEIPLAVEIGKILDLGDIPMKHAISFRGRLLHEDQSPARNLRLSVSPVKPIAWKRIASTFGTVTDEEGRFAMDGYVGQGRYLLEVKDQEGPMQSFLIDTRSPSGTEQSFYLKATNPVTLVMPETEQKGLTLFVLDDQGNRQGARVANGPLSLQLADGSYRLLVRDGFGNTLASKQILVSGKPLMLPLDWRAN